MHIKIKLLTMMAKSGSESETIKKSNRSGYESQSMNPPLLTGTRASSSDQSDSLSSYFFFFFFRFRTGCDAAAAEPLLLPGWLGRVIGCVDVFLLMPPPLCFFILPLLLAVALAAAVDASLSAAANRLEPRPCWTRSPRRFCSASMVRKVVMNSS